MLHSDQLLVSMVAVPADSRQQSFSAWRPTADLWASRQRLQPSALVRHVPPAEPMFGATYDHWLLKPVAAETCD